MKKILIFILALLALTVISLDYTSGHSVDDIVNMVYCPICDSFKSVKTGIVLLYILILIGLVPVIALYLRENTTRLTSLILTAVIPNRAPPSAV